MTALIRFLQATLAGGFAAYYAATGDPVCLGVAVANGLLCLSPPDS